MSKIIELTQCQFAIVDDSDYDALIQHHWHALQYKRSVYAGRKIRVGEKRMVLFMHRAILNPPSDMFVDHIDGNGLNCQRSNMRVVSQSQNCMNRRRDTRNTSGANGVTFHKSTGKWKVFICVNTDKKHLGYFEKFEDAVAARQAAEKEHFGEFANTKASTPEESKVVTNGIIATAVQNQPRKMDSRNKSGCPGVSWNSRKQSWKVDINTDNGREHVGWFADLKEAIGARRTAELNLL